jgi:hypothetical protein
MATQPMPQPQGSPDQGATPQPGAAPAGGSQQDANSLQQTLGKIMQVITALGSQNQIIQPEMQEVAGALRKAFLKTVQAGQAGPGGQPQQPNPAPASVGA